jgi:hypothetical protein
VQLMSPRTAQTVSNAFEGVVVRGTGRRAALEGYRAAGKTGTAQKSIGGRYANDKYVASFIGFAPLPNPKITILVQIDEPKGMHYGGDVCAPVFQTIAQEVLMQLHIPPDQNLPLPEMTPLVAESGSEDFLPNAAAVQPLIPTGNQPLPEDQREFISMRVGAKWVELPDFSGLSKRGVLKWCTDLGIHLRSSGSGVAVYQTPLPGTPIPSGATCDVTFANANLKGHLAAAEAHYSAQRDKTHSYSSDRP